MEVKLEACLEKTWEDEKEGERKRKRGRGRGKVARGNRDKCVIVLKQMYNSK